MRSMMDRLRPSREESTSAGSNPAPASRTITPRRPARRPRARRRQRDVDPCLARPGMAGHVGQRLAHGVPHRDSDRHRHRGAARRARPRAPRRARPGRGRASRRRPPRCRRAGRRNWPPGHLGGLTGVTERVLHQPDIVPAPAHHLAPVRPSARMPVERGQRVEHRVVQQPLMLAALGVSATGRRTARGTRCQPGQGGVRPRPHRRPSSSGAHQTAAAMASSRTAAATGELVPPAAAWPGPSPPSRPPPRRAPAAPAAPRGEPGRDDQLARHHDVQPVGGVAAHAGRHAPHGAERQHHAGRPCRGRPAATRPAAQQVRHDRGPPGHRGERARRGATDRPRRTSAR